MKGNRKLLIKQIMQRMEEAYSSGDNKLALELSQELDKQVVEAQSRKLYGRKDPHEKNKVLV